MRKHRSSDRLRWRERRRSEEEKIERRGDKGAKKRKRKMRQEVMEGWKREERVREVRRKEGELQ